jgi:hypothetical protein
VPGMLWMRLRNISWVRQVVITRPKNIHSQSTEHIFHLLRNTPDFFSVCVVEHPVSCTNSSLVFPSTTICPRHPPIHNHQLCSIREL